MSDIIAGICAGFSQTIIGHPLDTVKVLMQNGKTWRNLTVRTSYRGLGYPLISSVLVNSSTFTIYERTIKFTESAILSGAIAGFLTSPILFFFDIGKIKEQTNQRMSMQKIFTTPGFTTTVGRETMSLAIYFKTYDIFKNEYNVHPFLAGGISGLATWTFTYPLDIIRSRQMAQNITALQALSFGQLWKGFTPCALRAILVNGACFSTYDTVFSMLEKHNLE